MKKFSLFLSVLFLCAIHNSCSFFGGDADDPKIPIVITDHVTDIKLNAGSAVFNGQITFLGNPIYSEKGFVYATHSDPTINDTWKIVSGREDGAFQALVSGLKLGTTYYIRAYAKNNVGVAYGDVIALDFSEEAPDLQSLTPTGEIDGHDYVDLGLSVKWATYNVGAKSIEEFGEYYAWGKTTPYDEQLTYVNYYWVHNPCSPDNILSSIYDAATVNWGNSWRMPTGEEQKELLEKCDWRWVDNIYNSTTSGYIVTSKINKKSIFLPAAKYISHDKYAKITEKDGLYWSSWMLESHGKLSLNKNSGAGAIKFIDQSIGMVLPAEQFFATLGDGLTIRAVVGTPNDYLPNRDTVTIDIEETQRQGFSVSGSVDGFTYVDLGLPSRTLWATYNVGSTLPHEYGEYFCWGETEPKDGLYGYHEYYKFFLKWQEKGEFKGPVYSKYTWYEPHHGTVDGKFILDPEDDAATVNWSDRWCMPTSAQIEELNEYCNIYRKDVNVNGQTFRGIIVESTVNDNVMHLPYSEIKNDQSGLTLAYLSAWYWTCEVDDEEDYWALCGIHGDHGLEIFGTGRTNGLPVRAVVKK